MKANDNFIIQTAYACSGLSAVLVLIKLWQYDMYSWWFCVVPLSLWALVMITLFVLGLVYIALLAILNKK